MDALLAAATELVALVSPQSVEALAERFKRAERSKPKAKLLQLVSTPAARGALDRLLAEWARTTLSGEVVAGVLVGAAYARRETQRESTIELVWTGPTTPYVATRRTEQVLLDLIRHAKRDLFIVSFVAYDVAAVVAELNAAATRGVQLRMLLETSVSHGGSLSNDPISAMKACVPSAMLYVWTDRPAPFTDGRVHAKVAVADGTTAFLTSANLTGHALEKNMEAGVLIEGGRVPNGLRAHLGALIEIGVVQLAR